MPSEAARSATGYVNAVNAHSRIQCARCGTTQVRSLRELNKKSLQCGALQTAKVLQTQG